MDEFAPCIEWDEEKTAFCKRAFVDFIRDSIETSNADHYIYLIPPRFWEAMSGSLDWSVMGALATILMSLLTSEAENEGISWMKKYVVGERGGRFKDGLVTAHE